MTHFSPRPLSPDAISHLAHLQSEVDILVDRQDKYDRAKSLWNARSGSGNAPIWTEIKDKLKEAHRAKGLCQFCEFDRNSPTEHFFPKKHFPEFAFQWENYLLICHFCNSDCKGVKFAVFNPRGSDTVFKLPNTPGTYPIPPTDDAVLINPRTDDPAHFMTLDFFTGFWQVATGLDTRNQERFVYTRDLLQLNVNDSLVRHRKKAYAHYLQKLQEYSSILVATDFPGLLNALTPARWVMVVQERPFDTEKERILEVLKNDILDDPFPSVWREIKSQRATFPHIDQLFTAVPAALNW